MTKLHEVVAIEGGLQTGAKIANEEVVQAFAKKDEQFLGRVRTTSYFAEEDQKLDTVEESELVSCVMDRLLGIRGPNVRALDAYLQKEAANQAATADIVVGGRVLVGSVPAVVLLGLESRLTELRKVLSTIPTLSPGQTWKEDFGRRASGGVYESMGTDKTFRTKRMVKPIIMAPATKEHPAQVQAIQEDVPVAEIVSKHWSGMLPIATKAQLLDRADILIRAIKQARQRANMTEAPKQHIGDSLFDFLFESLIA